MRGTVAGTVVQQHAQRVVLDTGHRGRGVDDEPGQQLALVRAITPVLSGRTPKPSFSATAVTVQRRSTSRSAPA